MKAYITVVASLHYLLQAALQSQDLSPKTYPCKHGSCKHGSCKHGSCKSKPLGFYNETQMVLINET